MSETVYQLVGLAMLLRTSFGDQKNSGFWSATVFVAWSLCRLKSFSSSAVNNLIWSIVSVTVYSLQLSVVGAGVTGGFDSERQLGPSPTRTLESCETKADENG